MLTLATLNALFTLLDTTKVANVSDFVKKHRYSIGIYILFIETSDGRFLFYIGKSIQIGIRIRQHLRGARIGSNRCPILYPAMRKHGIENFSVAVLDLGSLPEKLLLEYEHFLIVLLKAPLNTNK